MDKMFTLTYLKKQIIQIQLSEETTYPILTYLRKQLIQVQPIWGNNLSKYELSAKTTYRNLTSQAFQGLPKPQIYLTWLFVVKQDHQNTPNSQQFINYCPKSQVNLYMAYNIDKTST